VITSFGEFERVYGSVTNLSFSASDDADPPAVNYLAHAVRAFFDNGGSRLYIGRTFILAPIPMVPLPPMAWRDRNPS
jgi:hypothetical protein